MVSRIIGKKFNNVGRYMDMLSLLLGETYTIINSKGKQIQA